MRFLLALALVLAPVSSWAATYYVRGTTTGQHAGVNTSATCGNFNDDATHGPCRCIYNLRGRLAAGDVVNVDSLNIATPSDTSNLNLIDPGASGTSVAPITYVTPADAARDTASLAASLRYTASGIIGSWNYITVRGFRFQQGTILAFDWINNGTQKAYGWQLRTIRATGGLEYEGGQSNSIQNAHLEGHAVFYYNNGLVKYGDCPGASCLAGANDPAHECRVACSQYDTIKTATWLLGNCNHNSNDNRQERGIMLRGNAQHNLFDSLNVSGYFHDDGVSSTLQEASMIILYMAEANTFSNSHFLMTTSPVPINRKGHELIRLREASRLNNFLNNTWACGSAADSVERGYVLLMSAAAHDTVNMATPCFNEATSDHDPNNNTWSGNDFRGPNLQLNPQAGHGLWNSLFERNTLITGVGNAFYWAGDMIGATIRYNTFVFPDFCFWADSQGAWTGTNIYGNVFLGAPGDACAFHDVPQLTPGLSSDNNVFWRFDPNHTRQLPPAAWSRGYGLPSCGTFPNTPWEVHSVFADPVLKNPGTVSSGIYPALDVTPSNAGAAAENGLPVNPYGRMDPPDGAYAGSIPPPDTLPPSVPTISLDYSYNTSNTFTLRILTASTGDDSLAGVCDSMWVTQMPPNTSVDSTTFRSYVIWEGKPLNNDTFPLNGMLTGAGQTGDFTHPISDVIYPVVGCCPVSGWYQAIVRDNARHYSFSKTVLGFFYP